MAVRVQLTVAAAAGGSPAAAEPPALTLKGQKVSLVLAGIVGEAAPDVGPQTWREMAPQAAFAKPVKLSVQQLVSAGVESCESLARLAFSQAFGVDASSFKLYEQLRLTITSAQHLNRWLATGELLALEQTGEGGVGGGAFEAASDELVFFFEAGEMVGAWRAAGAAAFDSCLLGGQAVDARFSGKVFAKLVGSTEAKVDAALGRQQQPPAPAGAEAAEAEAEAQQPLSLDVVLLRQIEAKAAQLRADSFALLGAEIDGVLAKKRPASSGGGAAGENSAPNPGAPRRDRTAWGLLAAVPPTTPECAPYGSYQFRRHEARALPPDCH